MPDGGHAVALPPKDIGHTTRRLALSAPRPGGADGNDGFVRLDGRGLDAHQTEVRPGGQHLGGLVHDVFMRDIAVREYDLIDVELADQSQEFALGKDRDAFGVATPGELGWIGASFDIGDLSGRECDDVVVRVVSKVDVEVVEVTTGSPHDQDVLDRHGLSS